MAAFENYWTNRLHKPWSIEVQAGFQNPAAATGPVPAAKEARETFLASDVGCGIDVFFGGGTFDFIVQTQAGRLVDSGLLKSHADWFADADVVPTEGLVEGRHLVLHATGDAVVHVPAAVGQRDEPHAGRD